MKKTSLTEEIERIERGLKRFNKKYMKAKILASREKKKEMKQAHIDNFVKLKAQRLEEKIEISEDKKESTT